MKILSLNCQRGYQPGLKEFLQKTLESSEYDFILLQEFAKEVPSYVQGVGPYDILQAYSEEVEEKSQTVIVHRKAYRLLEQGYVPFTKMRRDPVAGFRHATFGSLMARFDMHNSKVLIGCAHLHSGIDRKVRQAQVRKIKEQALSLAQVGDMVIFGGDCNFGLPRERVRAGQSMSPQFVCVTGDIGPTLDGRYSENVPHLPNRIAAFLWFFGVKTPLWTDQLFIDARTVKQGKVSCRVLPDRVSDHSPVELALTLGSATIAIPTMR